jgi:hypothetical protein
LTSLPCPTLSTGGNLANWQHRKLPPGEANHESTLERSRVRNQQHGRQCESLPVFFVKYHCLAGASKQAKAAFCILLAKTMGCEAELKGLHLDSLPRDGNPLFGVVQLLALKYRLGLTQHGLDELINSIRMCLCKEQARTVATAKDCLEYLRRLEVPDFLKLSSSTEIATGGADVAAVSVISQLQFCLGNSNKDEQDMISEGSWSNWSVAHPGFNGRCSMLMLLSTNRITACTLHALLNTAGRLLKNTLFRFQAKCFHSCAMVDQDRRWHVWRSTTLGFSHIATAVHRGVEELTGISNEDEGGIARLKQATEAQCDLKCSIQGRQPGDAKLAHNYIDPLQSK